jgi:HEAT repeat protein
MEIDTFSLHPLDNWLKSQKPRFLLAAIGIEKYESPKIPDVINALNDLNGIVKILKDDFGYEIRQEMVLCNETSDKKAILNLFQHLSKLTQPQDVVVIYYAGHGWVDAKTGEGYLVPYDARMINDELPNPETCIPWDDIRDACLNLPANHIFLASDACFSGTIFDESFPDDEMSHKICQALAASSSVQYALSSERQHEGESEHSPFTQALIDGLSGYANRTEDDSTITGWELIYYVEERVREATSKLQTPQRPVGNWLQRPGIAIGGASFEFCPQTSRLRTSILLGLHSAESTVRIGALEFLVSSDDSMNLKVQACAHALQDPILSVRLEAAKVMGQLNSSAALEHLMRKLGDGEKEKDVRQQLIDSIGLIGSRGYISASAINTLKVSLCSDPEYEVRYRIAEAFGMFKFSQENDPDGELKRSVISILNSNINDRDSDVELWAAWALTRLGMENGLLRLIDALNDLSRQATRRRRAAINMGELYELADERAVQALCRAVSDPDQKVGYLACEALGKVGNEQAVPILVSVLDSPVPNTSRYAATAIEMITNRLRQKNNTEAIKRIRKIASESLLKQFDEYSDTAFRGRCAASLGALGEETAIPVFRRVLFEILDGANKKTDEYPQYVRAAVVWALGIIEGPSSVELISRFLEDENVDVQIAVLKVFIAFFDNSKNSQAMLLAMRDKPNIVNKINEIAQKDPNVEANRLAKIISQNLR